MDVVSLYFVWHTYHPCLCDVVALVMFHGFVTKLCTATRHTCHKKGLHTKQRTALDAVTPRIAIRYAGWRPD